MSTISAPVRHIVAGIIAGLAEAHAKRIYQAIAKAYPETTGRRRGVAGAGRCCRLRLCAYFRGKAWALGNLEPIAQGPHALFADAGRMGQPEHSARGRKGLPRRARN